jgi:hypothetical protein
VYTSSPLYLHEGEYFSDGEFLAANNASNGDGRLYCSYKNPGNGPTKILFNLVWHEVQTTVENSYQRLCASFPLLENKKKKLLYSQHMLFLAIHASARLHNWMMITKSLSYSADESPEVLISLIR